MKLLFIGWDAADSTIIELLLERGLMPCLEQFCSKASSGALQPVRPWDITSLWTSIATGKRATRHGVVNAIEVDPTGTKIQPTSRWSCTARPVWKVLSDAGFRTHALGWPASHPAEPINGISVSDQFVLSDEPTSIQPPKYRDTLRGLRLSPEAIDSASITALALRAKTSNAAMDPRKRAIARFLATTATIHGAATWALEHAPSDFFAVRYPGLAELKDIFGSAFASDQAGVRSSEAELFGDVIPNAYHFFDMLLKRLLELAGPNTSVMLVAARGRMAESHTAPSIGGRFNPGMLIAGGPAFTPCRQILPASVCDIAPTILRVFDLLPEPDVDGRVLRDVLSKSARVDSRSGDDVDQSSRRRSQSADVLIAARDADPSPKKADGDAINANTNRHRDPQTNFVPIAIKQLDLERRRRLAEAWSDAGEHDRAVRILEQLVEIAPTSVPFRTALAEAHFLAGRYGACRELIQSLQADGIDSPLAETGLAATDVREGRTTSALEHLSRGETMEGASAEVLELIGRAYLRLRRPADASRVLDRAIAIDPTLGSAHDGRAIASLLAGNAVSAEHHARAAVALSPQSYDARYHLGLALARQSRLDEAIDMFRLAVEIDRRGRGAAAHRHLAKLLERRGDYALAVHHRAQSHREGTSC